MKTVSIIIPNWNGRDHLLGCLLSLRNQTYKKFEVIVVDNNSQDDSVSLIQKKFPEIKILTNDKNYGFAAAINTGVKSTLAEYVVFLNNDTEADRNWLKALIETADKHSEVISVCSKLLNFYNRKKIDGIGIEINEVGQAISLGWGQNDFGQFEQEQYIFGATGGAALFRRKEFVGLGLFDEHYFMYFEEVDFAFRAQFAGYKSIFCPRAIVYHKHKATSGKNLAKLEYWQFKNMTQTIIKDMPTAILIKNWRWFKIMLVHFNTILYQLRNGYIWPSLMVEMWLLYNLPRLIKTRMEVQAHKKIDDRDIEIFLAKKKITFWGLKTQ